MITVSGGREVNFAFAFNNFDFSDRILRLEITVQKKFPYLFWWDFESSDGANFKTLHISSTVLAAQSPFFYKASTNPLTLEQTNVLFKSGMKQSQKKTEVCLKIKNSEEASLMDLLRFMYGETALKATSFQDLVDLLIVADKYEVVSCMSYCVEMLLNLPMSLKHAMFFVEHPSSVLMSEIMKPLIDAAKQIVVAPYKDFTRSREEAMQLPLSTIEIVLGSVGLQVVSEDDVYDFVLEWARASYPKLKERREILTKRLAPLILFPNMSVPKLKEVILCSDFEHYHVSKIVMGALFSKVERSCGQLVRDSKDLAINKFGSGGRVYNPHCVVFFDLTKNECSGLFPNGTLDSPPFRLGRELVMLRARCGDEKERLGLFVLRMPGAETCTLDYKLAVMKKSSMEFECRLEAYNRTVMASTGWGKWDLLGITWTELMSDDSDYFIDGVLRLRAELTLKA